MPLKRLNQRDVKRFSDYEEAAMGLQVVRLPEESGWFGYVIGDLVFMTIDRTSVEQLSGLLSEPWMRGADFPDGVGIPHQRAFEDWLASLPEAASPDDPVPRSELLAFGLIVPRYLPPAPSRPASVYGHLPFGWRCGSNDVFYRCEPWPKSRRIDQGTRTIKHGTYACPASELPFIPTGFAAIARYALPNLTPACFRWELQPVAGTVLDCGASVPLYGQSGGGVEVFFRTNTSNRGPIANPIVLPAL